KGAEVLLYVGIFCLLFHVLIIAFALAKVSFPWELRLVLRSKISAILYGSKSRKTAKIENLFSIFCFLSARKKGAKTGPDGNRAF
ncbi:MAG: hypothetical protein J1E06_09130, partial [Acutalibacter sp.]|nr:hypothetical protein [Acutalibacter sp.]